MSPSRSRRRGKEGLGLDGASEEAAGCVLLRDRAADVRKAGGGRQDNMVIWELNPLVRAHPAVFR